MPLVGYQTPDGRMVRSEAEPAENISLETAVRQLEKLTKENEEKGKLTVFWLPDVGEITETTYEDARYVIVDSVLRIICTSEEVCIPLDNLFYFKYEKSQNEKKE